MQEPLPFWKKKFYVHPIQRKYFFLCLIPLLGCAFLMILLLFGPLYLELRGQAFYPGKLVTERGMSALAIGIWPAVLISMVVSGILSFYATNRFAGPLFRLERILKGVANGDLPMTFHVRKGDDLQEFAGLLDAVFRRVTSAIMAVKEREAVVAKELAALQGKIKGGLHNTDEIVRDLEAIGRGHRDVENILDSFRPRSQDDGEPAPRPGQRPVEASSTA